MRGSGEPSELQQKKNGTYGEKDSREIERVKERLREVEEERRPKERLLGRHHPELVASLPKGKFMT